MTGIKLKYKNGKLDYDSMLTEGMSDKNKMLIKKYESANKDITLSQEKLVKYNRTILNRERRNE